MHDIKKIDFTLSLFSRLMYPRHVVMATCVDNEGKPNIITLSFSMPVSYKPPILVISVAHTNYSHELIMQQKEYVINVPSVELAGQTQLCGEISGRDHDKFQEAELTPIPAQKVKPPLIEECHGHLECRVRESIPAGDHTLFLADVVAASANEGIFNFTRQFPEFSKFTPLFAPIKDRLGQYFSFIEKKMDASWP
jgi:flavin reductase (DIM6/NTAB) family NADH-FMN oxidoreductase RutF